MQLVVMAKRLFLVGENEWREFPAVVVVDENTSIADAVSSLGLSLEDKELLSIEIYRPASELKCTRCLTICDIAHRRD